MAAFRNGLLRRVSALVKKRGQVKRTKLTSSRSEGGVSGCATPAKRSISQSPSGGSKVTHGDPATRRTISCRPGNAKPCDRLVLGHVHVQPPSVNP
jgi:hypothetical protein